MKLLVQTQDTAESDDDLPQGEKKWSCEYCTYDNWPNTTKCTMCRQENWQNKTVFYFNNLLKYLSNFLLTVYSFRLSLLTRKMFFHYLTIDPKLEFVLQFKMRNKQSTFSFKNTSSLAFGIHSSQRMAWDFGSETEINVHWILGIQSINWGDKLTILSLRFVSFRAARPVRLIAPVDGDQNIYRIAGGGQSIQVSRQAPFWPQGKVSNVLHAGLV